jgi:FdhE protein
MITSANDLDGLRRERPEWAPWLAVIKEIVRETGARQWDAVVPRDIDVRQATAPLLAGITLSLHARSLRHLFERLIRIAALDGTPRMRTLEATLDPNLDVLALFGASLCQESARIKEVADGHGADAEALQAVAALLPLPFLQACHRRWASSIHGSWVQGYCPLCGSWPAFAEVRGIERRRYFRCGRCSAEWHAQALACPYCATADHNELMALVPESSDSRAVIDACKRCRGYVKTFSRLQGCSSDMVMVEDLASVAFDVAALQEGYTRPPDPGYPLGVMVIDRGAARRFFAWNA